MALEFQSVEVVLRGLQQKADDKTRPPDMLTRAVNVEFDKDGALNKRRGYQHVDVANTVNLFDDDEVMLHVATRKDELVVVTYDYVVGLGSRNSTMRGGDAFVYRGPNNRGHVRLGHVSTSRISRAIGGDGP